MRAATLASIVILAILQHEYVHAGVTTIDAAPYIVSITYRQHHVCGAALIRPNIIITVAHCFPTRIGQLVTDRREYLAYAGVDRLNAVARSATPPVRLAYVVVHPEYSPETAANDVAVVRLKRYLKLGATVQLLALPGLGFAMPADELAEVTGWCRAKIHNTTIEAGDQLQEVRMKLSEDHMCVMISADEQVKRMFCAPQREPNDVAQMHIPCTSENSSDGVMAYERRVLLGFTTWGGECGTHFSDAGPLVSWIAQYVGNNVELVEGVARKNE